MNIGTIGTSLITDRVMGQMLEYDEYKYEAIYTREEHNADYLKNKYSVKKIYTNLHDMLNDDEVECIYIASPNSLHFKQAKMSLESGKHVILEKPFCTSVEECDELIEIAKKNKCFLFEGITTVHNPNYKEIKKLVDNLESIKIVECNLSKYSSKYDEFLSGKTPNIFSKEFAGGALMDINVYNIHFVVGLFGKPNYVQYIPNIKRDIDTSGVLLLNYNDFIAVCIGSKDNNGYNFCQIQAENGVIVSEGLSSRVSNVKYCIDKEEKEFSYQDRVFAHYYYLGEILNIVKNKDYKKCFELLQHTRDVVWVLEKAREC